MPISYKHKIYTTLGTPTNLSGNVVSATDSAGVPVKDYTVKGKTIIWNQLLDKSKYPATTTSSGVTFTNNGDGSITVDGTAGSTANAYFSVENNISVIQGHKYYATMSKPIEHANFWLGLYANSGDAPFPGGTILDRNGKIVDCVRSSDVSYSINLYKNASVNNATVKPQFFDLTEMFGVGNEPSTPAEFSVMFPDDYYPYNAGELKSVATTSVEASGVERFQMFQNPNFSNTVVDTREEVAFSVQQLASPYEGFFFRKLQEPGLVSGVFTIPVSGKCRIKHNGLVSDIDFFYFTSVKNHKYYIYINFTSINPRVVGGVTYDKAQFFDLTQMFGAGNEPTTPAEFWQRVPEKLYGYNPNDYKSANIPSSKYFPDGMKSAGSAYDEINFLSQKAIKRIGVRAYQAGDENDTNVVTDKTNTVYALATPVETAITPPLQALSTFKGFTSFSAPNSLTQNGPLSVTYYAEGGANPESGWLTSYKRKLYMGRSVEWNQLLQNPNFSNVVVDTRDHVDFRIRQNISPYTDWVSLNVSSPTIANAFFIATSTGYGEMIHNGATKNIWFGEFVIVKSHKYYATLNFTSANPLIIGGVVYDKAQLFDLTQMFGAGNEPTTPEEFWSYFDHKLYPYNTGETQPLFKISRKSQWGN